MRSILPHPPVCLVALLLTGGCDCDDKIRKVVSNTDPAARRGASGVDRQGQPISSAPRETEPNDTLTQASPFTLGKELRSITASLHEKDSDFFALSASSRETFEILVEPDEGVDVDLVVSVTDDPNTSEGALIYDVAAAGEGEAIPIVAIGPRPLFIGVSAKKGGIGPYTLRFKRRLSAGSLESEPNDSVSSAVTLRAPTDIEGFYDRPDDRDWYAIDFPENAPAYALRVEPIKNLQQSIKLYIDPDAPMMEGEIGASAPFVIPNIALIQGERLWVEMTAREAFDRSSPYLLSLKPTPRPPKEALLEVEPNDDVTRAQPLAMKEAPSHRIAVRGYLHGSRDVDTFSLLLGETDTPDTSSSERSTPQPEKEKEGAIERDLLPALDDLRREGAEEGARAESAEMLVFAPFPSKALSPHLIELAIKPIDPETRLAMTWKGGERQVAPAAGEALSLCQLPLDPGAYTFTVEAASSKTKSDPLQPDYDLVIKDVRAMPGQASTSEVEPNDTVSTPDPLLLGGEASRGYIGSPKDKDVYHLDIGGLDDGAFVSLSLSLGVHPLDLSLTMVDEQGAMIAESVSVGAGGAEMLEVSVPPGRYFVVVESGNGARCVPYELRAMSR